jgi:hypothetical protein
MLLVAKDWCKLVEDRQRRSTGTLQGLLAYRGIEKNRLKAASVWSTAKFCVNDGVRPGGMVIERSRRCRATDQHRTQGKNCEPPYEARRVDVTRNGRRSPMRL